MKMKHNKYNYCSTVLHVIRVSESVTWFYDKNSLRHEPCVPVVTGGLRSKNGSFVIFNQWEWRIDPADQSGARKQGWRSSQLWSEQSLMVSRHWSHLCLQSLYARQLCLDLVIEQTWMRCKQECIGFKFQMKYVYLYVVGWNKKKFTHQLISV